MSTNFEYRRNAVGTLTNTIGVYVLCDLEQVPIYVGQSTDGIRRRVQRHLTSARSDIIANRQIDVWEIAWVHAYPESNRERMNVLEAALFHKYHRDSPLMNGTIPSTPNSNLLIPEPAQIVQVMSDEELQDKQDPAQRLPRQAAHYAQLVGHFLAVKNSEQIARAMDAHFQRLLRYHQMMLGLGSDEE